MRFLVVIHFIQQNARVLLDESGQVLLRKPYINLVEQKKKRKMNSWMKNKWSDSPIQNEGGDYSCSIVFWQQERNTMISDAVYRWWHWLIGKNATGWLYRSWLISVQWGCPYMHASPCWNSHIFIHGWLAPSLFHSYIGPAWHKVSKHIFYLTECCESLTIALVVSAATVISTAVQVLSSVYWPWGVAHLALPPFTKYFVFFFFSLIARQGGGKSSFPMSSSRRTSCIQ